MRISDWSSDVCSSDLFKRTTILGYEIPWNNFDFSYGAYIALEQRHVERKCAALACYASQQHRRYADPEYVRHLARVHGVKVNRERSEERRVGNDGVSPCISRW